jgi:hypothetical protein
MGLEEIQWGVEGIHQDQVSETVAGSCKDSNEPKGFIKCGEFIECQQTRFSKSLVHGVR